MSDKYSNPPVVEALCEVYFGESRWDETVPGRLFDRVQQLGFVGKEPVHLHETNVVLNAPGGPAASVTQHTRMRFLTADRSRLIQVEPHLVVVNQLRPYPAFEAWSPIVSEVARIYADLTAPVRVQRIGLRYINQISFPDARVDLDAWFQVSPRLPPAWRDETGGFFVRVEKKVAEDLGLILTFGSAPSAQERQSAFVLDLYSVLSPTGGADPAAIGTLLDRGHACIEDAFEGSITEKLRARFRDAPSP